MHSSTPHQQENSQQQQLNPHPIQPRIDFQRKNNISVKTPTRGYEQQSQQNQGIPIRQSRFSKTVLIQNLEENLNERQIREKKKIQREQILIDNTPMSIRLRDSRRGSLNVQNIFESINNKQYSFNHIASLHDLEIDENNHKKQQQNQRQHLNFGDIPKQNSQIYTDDDENNNNNNINDTINSNKNINNFQKQSGQQDSYKSIPRIKSGQDIDSSENGSEMYDSVSLNKSNNGGSSNLQSPTRIPKRNNQRTKTMPYQMSKYFPLESLQEKEELEEPRPMKSRNLVQVSPLQKQIFQQKILSISNFNMPQISSDFSPIQQMEDNVIDGFQNDIQFSLQQSQSTQLELCEIEQLNQIKESIQLQQQQSLNINSNNHSDLLHISDQDRKNFHDDNNFNKSFDLIDRRNDKRRTTFRSLVIIH